MTDLYAASAMIIGMDRKAGPVFNGTCFGFRRQGWFLTARHCLRELPIEQLSVALLTGDKIQFGLKVNLIIPHPTADIALIHSPMMEGVCEVFSDVNDALGPGSDVTAFGFPEDVLSGDPGPTPRLFRGFVQRVFEYKSPLGYQYVAAELGFGTPAGLSGGPLIVSMNHLHVAGVVTENVQASTFLQMITEVKDGNREYSEKVHSMINYGVAVDLGPIRGWLDDQLPVPVEA